MKVLKKGHPQTQKEWSVEAVCTGKGNGNGGCGAKLLVKADDLYETRGHCRDETYYYVTFRCPCCQVQTDLENVPSKIKSGLVYKTQEQLNRE